MISVTSCFPTHKITKIKTKTRSNNISGDDEDIVFGAMGGVGIEDNCWNMSVYICVFWGLEEGDDCMVLFLAWVVVVMVSGINFQLEEELSGSANGLSGSDQILRDGGKGMNVNYCRFVKFVKFLNFVKFVKFVIEFCNKKYFKLLENEFFSSFLC